MEDDTITKEIVTRAALHLKETFSAYVIIGLPIKETEEPVIASTGPRQVVRDLIALANEKVKD
jgi:hypothetical protein